MNSDSLNIVILGLSITSSWGNGHATTYRGLVRELAARNHKILFLERDVPWYASNRDLPSPPYCDTRLYSSIDELKESYSKEIKEADFVMVGSYVPEGIMVGEWVTDIAGGITAFYDIDTPVTLAKLQKGDTDYISADLISKYQVYFSFTGGPVLKKIEDTYGSPLALPLYCSVDPNLYFPENTQTRWDMGYLGTYSDDRQPVLDTLLMKPAREWGTGRFVVAGPQYPDTITWPANVERIQHLSLSEHRAFYCSQKYTLNVTRADMVKEGYSPSVRLFEAAACGTPILSDWWNGLDTLFEPGKEILISHSPEETLKYLREIPEDERLRIGERARERVMKSHTAYHRAIELEGCIYELLGNTHK